MDSIRVLVAEDDQSTRDLYKLGLAEAMFETRFADNGRDALALYQTWKPDMLILDIVMPVMTGFSVLQEIRGTENDRSTTIIMSTSLSDSSDVQDCLKFGIQGYIVKPFSFKEIGNRIIRYYDGHKTAHR